MRHYRIKGATDALGKIGLDTMLLGLGLPTTLTAKITAVFVRDFLKAIASNIITGDPTNVTDQQLIDIIMNMLEATLEEATILAPLFRKIIENGLDFDPENCAISQLKYEFSSQGSTVEFDCFLVICADVTPNLIFGSTINDWTLKGSCQYKCSPGTGGARCPCVTDNGMPTNQTISINQGGTGDSCGNSP